MLHKVVAWLVAHVHELEEKLVEMTIELRSYWAATTWNKRSALRLSMG